MVKDIPAWLTKALDLEGALAIEKTVKEAEMTTAGEIVPLIVQGSTVNASAPLLAVFIGGFLVLTIKHGFWLYELSGYNSIGIWSALFAATVCAGFSFGMSPMGQMVLTPRWEKRRQVQQRALLAFYEAGLNHTQGRTGILLFVSWRERQAVVLADEGIAKFCQVAAFQDVVAELVKGAKERQVVAGFCRAVTMSAAILARHIPRRPDDVNELKDYLRIID